MSILKNIQITLFGSNPHKQFKNTKSLSDNFFSMCSLPFHKPDSNETKALLAVLSKCTLNLTTKDPLSSDERKQDVATLEIAKLAIQNWQIQRQQTSTRHFAVSQFENSVKQLQFRLLSQDENEMMRRDNKVSGNVNTWHNPLQHHATLKSYLSLPLQTEFDQQWNLYSHLNHREPHAMRRYMGIRS